MPGLLMWTVQVEIPSKLAALEKVEQRDAVWMNTLDDLKYFDSYLYLHLESESERIKHWRSNICPQSIALQEN